ncbi:MAG: ABC transporter ATP-binding protein [Thermoleophilia bacterium]
MSAMTVVRPEKLEVEGLVKTFPGTRRRPAVTAIDGIDLTVTAGELVCIVGASGCGKSTLLNVIGGLEPADAGRVEVDGEPVIGPGADRGMVFQGYSLYPWRTVAENVAFGLEATRMPRAERRERVDELLAVMGLTDWAGRIPRELSGGMRQRVAIARALAPRPDVLLLDEPFGALDAQTKRVMQDFLLRVWRDVGTTILMVTHDVEEAVYLSGRVYVLTSHPGRVAAEVPVPLPADRDPRVKRDELFLDLRDHIQEILVDQVRA